jgi:hypothetical protein
LWVSPRRFGTEESAGYERLIRSARRSVIFTVREVRISNLNDKTPAPLLKKGKVFVPSTLDERINPSGMRDGLTHLGQLRENPD